ncbi:MAG: winged helix-turn-helix transcriptional regulator [Zoogloea sp.]|nr:winged helix-turn-helix transcriptional regulator [Zoogloea sp.]
MSINRKGSRPGTRGVATPPRQKNGILAGQSALASADFVKTDIVDLIAKQEHIETAARALKAISHPLRLKILCVVGSEEVCVQDIVEAVGTSQSNISQHLAILRDKGVLLTRKDANRVYYRVGDTRTLQLIVMMREVFCNDDA